LLSIANRNLAFVLQGGSPKGTMPDEVCDLRTHTNPL
jgi:hypothetical protein